MQGVSIQAYGPGIVNVHVSGGLLTVTPAELMYI